MKFKLNDLRVIHFCLLICSYYIKLSFNELIIEKQYLNESTLYLKDDPQRSIHLQLNSTNTIIGNAVRSINDNNYLNMFLINMQDKVRNKQVPLNPSNPATNVKISSKVSVFNNKRNLYWVSNNAGLFSHFFQIKYLYATAIKWHRNLVIIPYKTIHLTDLKKNNKSIAINLCDIFVLNDDSKSSQSISCKKSLKISAMKCYPKFRSLQRFSHLKDVCFSGRVWGKSGVIPLHQKLEIMNLHPKLNFQIKYINKFINVINFLNININNISSSISNTSISSICNKNIDINKIFPYFDSNNHSNNNDYNNNNHSNNNNNNIVIHWRRGDQLTTRCTSKWGGLKDHSINCRSVDELIYDIKYFVSFYPIRNYTNILIATNEKNLTILNKLRNNQFIIISDLINSFKICENDKVLSSLDEFIIESQFMLYAKTFISYGISQINDVIEYERKQRVC